MEAIKPENIVPQNSNLQNQNWFWRTFSNPWKIILYYYLLTCLGIIIFSNGNPNAAVAFPIFAFLIMFTMPIGIIYLLNIPNNGLIQSPPIKFDDYGLFIILYSLAMLGCIITIDYYKRKKNRILKGLIITILTLITLSFIGLLLSSITKLMGVRGI